MKIPSLATSHGSRTAIAGAAILIMAWPVLAEARPAPRGGGGVAARPAAGARPVGGGQLNRSGATATSFRQPGGGGGAINRGGNTNAVNRGGNTYARGGTNVSGNTNIRGGNTVVDNRHVNNVNVNVDADHGWAPCCGPGGGYYDHPVATAAAVGVVAGATAAVTSAAIGSMVYSLPPSGCTTVVSAGVTYSRCGSVWYEPRYAGTSVSYVVVNAPV